MLDGYITDAIGRVVRRPWCFLPRNGGDHVGVDQKTTEQQAQITPPSGHRLQSFGLANLSVLRSNKIYSSPN